jgi:hypothetical protein
VVIWVMTADINDDVDLPEEKKRLISPIGRYGLAGRGVAVLIVGIYWISAALHGNASNAHELGGTLQAVQQHSQGWLLLLTLGVALLHPRCSTLSRRCITDHSLKKIADVGACRSGLTSVKAVASLVRLCPAKAFPAGSAGQRRGFDEVRQVGVRSGVNRPPPDPSCRR